MDINTIKSNLRDYYNHEAVYRSTREKQGWKVEPREAFRDLLFQENKKHLLEIGAGTGQDSQFFMENGLDVIAVDLSKEMVRICKEKGINAFELDFYNICELNKKFDCVWAMNTLLHVPKSDLPGVLQNIDAVLNADGLFYVGVYGGEDTEHTWVNDQQDQSNAPRFFSLYSEAKLKEALQEVFEIISFRQLDSGRGIDFQSVIMRKKLNPPL